MTYFDASVWVAALHRGHEAHQSASNAIETSPIVWNRILALEVEHSLRRIQHDEHRTQSLEDLAVLVSRGGLIESDPQNRSILSAMAEASRLSARHTVPGSKVGAMDVVHVVLASHAGATLVTRDVQQAEFAELSGLVTASLLTRRKKAPAGDGEGHEG